MKKIMFSDKFGLTQAVLDGRKTMTRRLEMDCNMHFYLNKFENVRLMVEGNRTCVYSNEEELLATKKNRYKVGEVVAIAQSYQSVYNECGLGTMDCLVQYIKISKGWNNKMFVNSELMPHDIRITNIKVERLQDISEEDCLKEGIQYLGLEYEDYGDPQYSFQGSVPYTCAKDAFSRLIDKVQGKGTWHSNPYVWSYEFELID